MKKNTINPEEAKAPEGQLMTRKQAIKKSGYMALSAATMMMLFNTNAQAASAPAAPSNSTPSKPNQPSGIWDD